MILEDLINTFNQKNKRERKPSPHNIFLVVKGPEIYEQLKINKGSRPNIKEVRQIYSDSWRNISNEDKQLYERASIELGYIKPSFSRPINSKFLDKRLDKMNLSLSK